MWNFKQFWNRKFNRNRLQCKSSYFFYYFNTLDSLVTFLEANCSRHSRVRVTGSFNDRFTFSMVYFDRQFYELNKETEPLPLNLLTQLSPFCVQICSTLSEVVTSCHD